MVSNENLAAIWQLIQQGDIKRAEVVVSRWIRESNTDQGLAEAYLARAHCKLLSERPQEALEDWDQAFLCDSEVSQFPKALEIRADAHFALYEMSSVGFAGSEEQITSTRLYHQLITDFPSDTNRGWWHYQLGRVLLSANRIEEANSHFHLALQYSSRSDSLHAHSYERLAFIAYYEDRNLISAIDFLDHALNLYPDRASREWQVEILLLKARITLDLNHLNQAINCIEDAVSILDPKGIQRPATLFTAAEILMKMPNQEEAAIPLLEEFLQLSKRPPGIDVGWARAQELLGEAYFKNERYQDAVSSFRQALHHNPYSPWSSTLRYQLACAYYQSGNYDQTCECLSQLIASEESEGGKISDYRIYDLLGNAHFALGRYDAARSAYSKALDLTTPHSQENTKIKRYYEFAESRLLE